MPEQNVVIEQVTVRSRGEWQYFQIHIPKDAESILGVETGLHVESVLPAPATPSTLLQSLAVQVARLFGELRLQQVGRAGLMYAGRVTEQDNSLAFADFSNLQALPARNWSHQSHGWEDGIQLNPSLLIGMYRDLIGERLGQDLVYTVNVCIWYKRKEAVQ